MSNAEPSSVPVPIGPRALLRVEALSSERHPAAVYLSSRGSGSRRTMRQSLGVIANLISGGRADFRFHDLRHSFASLLASKGVSIQVIAKALGHSSSTMAERYARPNEEAMKSIVSALNSARTEVPARAGKPEGHRKKSNSFSNSSEDVGASRGV